MPSDLPDHAVREALLALCGAVASMERDDHVAVDTLITLLRRSFDHVSDVLVIISLVTLDRLDAALNGDDRRRSGSQLDARLLLSNAVGAGRADRCTVDAAAWRLDAIRLGDLAGAGADIAESCFIATDDELIRGAIALLATIVAFGAERNGMSSQQAAGDLCLAASMSAAGSSTMTFG
jgi:hypothetical protein